jgi:enoyl-CoA hydratase/carnithine racemase
MESNIRAGQQWASPTMTRSRRRASQSLRRYESAFDLPTQACRGSVPTHARAIVRPSPGPLGLTEKTSAEEAMAYEHVLLDTEDGVGIITLNRPDKLNAMNRKLSGELHDAVKRLEADDAIGCIVITGAGDRAFSAGGDIHEQREDDRRFTETELEARCGRGSYEIGACAKPTFGMMNGLAYGGAAVLASSLDMRVGCENTRFRFLAAAYGRINSTWTLPNQVGWPIAKELLFTARVVEAEEAHRIGLLNHLVPREQLRSRTMELARMIAGNDRGAVMGIKALLLRQRGENLERQWREERDYTTHVFKGARAEQAFPEFLARHGRPAG